jgi:hypothetical protein
MSETKLLPCPFCNNIPSLPATDKLVACTNQRCAIYGRHMPPQSWNGRTDQLSTPQRERDVLREALQRVWDDDECGWLISGTNDKEECVKCGSFATSRERIRHKEDCLQGYLFEALQSTTSGEGKKGTE